jgi:hypothetical protein
MDGSSAWGEEKMSGWIWSLICGRLPIYKVVIGSMESTRGFFLYEAFRRHIFHYNKLGYSCIILCLEGDMRLPTRRHVWPVPFAGWVEVTSSSFLTSIGCNTRLLAAVAYRPPH